MRKPKETHRCATQLQWRYHDSGNTRYRVWNVTWPGDSFEILSPGDFVALQKVCQTFGISLQEAED